MSRLRTTLRGDGSLPIGEALHPVTIAAVLLLFLNDWVLKAAFPHGWPHAVTGKLSDIAGLAAAPVILTALTGLLLLLSGKLGLRTSHGPHLTQRRLVLAIAATGICFCAVKLSPAASHAFVALLSHVRHSAVMLDRSDLFCLPALGLAYFVGRDEIRAATASQNAE
ncbi:hypothetical protein BH11MYX2_BH11MYX2_04140 [soil metagenome]